MRSSDVEYFCIENGKYRMLLYLRMSHRESHHEQHLLTYVNQKSSLLLTIYTLAVGDYTVHVHHAMTQ